jgi:hypothetical protein
MLEELIAMGLVAEREAEFQRYLRQRGVRWHGLPRGTANIRTSPRATGGRQGLVARLRLAWGSGAES